MRDGRLFVRERIARVRRREDGRAELVAPSPGLFRGLPSLGDVVSPGGVIGELEVLGVLHRLRVPDDAFGVVVELPPGGRLARRPVDAATVLAVLDPEGARAGVLAEHGRAAPEGAPGGPVFRTPLGGRYYARPSPGAEPFVRVGDEIATGTTVALIEVMKTFNRVSYGGPGLPQRARVTAIVCAEGEDIETGDVLLELEPAVG